MADGRRGRPYVGPVKMMRLPAELIEAIEEQARAEYSTFAAVARRSLADVFLASVSKKQEPA